MENIRILHVIPAFGGGISSYVKNLITAENHDNINMDITGFGEFPHDYIKSIQEADGNVFTLPSIHRNPIGFIKTYRKILVDKNYSVVHCHFSGYRGFVFKLVAKICGIKYIAVHAHRSSDEKKNILFPVTVKISQFLSRSFADCLFTCSAIAADYIFGETYCKKHVVYMMPNSIDKKQYFEELSNDEKKAYRKSLKINSSKIIIGHVGRFNLQKNHTFVLQIIARLAKIDQNFILLLIGDGELKNDIEEKVKEKGLTQYVKFLGMRKDVNKLLQIMDICILPSLFEGLPTIAVEAQAAGTPIILSNKITDEVDLKIGGVKYESIDEGVSCWCDAILNYTKIFPQKMNTDKRMSAFVNKGFINEAMRLRYVNHIKAMLKNEQEVLL